MPIVKQGSGIIAYTLPLHLDEFLQTGALSTAQFFFADLDRLKQCQFDLSSQSTNTTLTLKSANTSSVTLTLPSTTGTLASGSFTTVQTPSGTSPVATGATDTLTIAVDGTMKATGNSGTDTVTLSSVTPTVTISASAIDWSLGQVFSKTISGNTTFTFSNTTDGQTIIVAITAGSGNTVAWPTTKWAAGTPPTQTSSGTDVYTFVKVGSTFYGSVLQAMA